MPNYDLLIDKFIDGSLSPDEREVLKRWVLESESNMSFFKGRLKESSRKMSVDFDADGGYERFLENITSERETSKIFSTTLKYAAVLVILIAIGFFAKQWLDQSSPKTSIEVVEKQSQPSIGKEIVIKLPDGTTQVLSERDETVTAANGSIVANKKGNSLAFDKSKKRGEDTPRYNEVFIPYGQTFKLRLSDGTLVWLNAGSKLRFPQNFSDVDKNRMVYLEGEAFFDVAKNKDQPFIVNTQEIDVKVFGTKFNISSYKTDDYIATTLVEGSVSVYETRTPDNEMLLAPSFQANFDKFGNNFGKTKVDTAIYTAWMHGRLIIDNLKFSEILARLERRYAVKFVNQTESLDDEIYKGEFMDEDIESVLKTISMSTPFAYEINQNIITITE